MADTKLYKTEIEPWFLNSWVKARHPECIVEKRKVPLKWGGVFECDAVATRDEKIEAVYCLSCSEYFTSGGNRGPGKLHKIRGDVFWLLAIECPYRCLVFSGKTLYDQLIKDQQKGRFPPEIDLQMLQLPDHLSTIVRSVSAAAVAEVSPNYFKTTTLAEYDPMTATAVFEFTESEQEQ